MQSIRSFYVKRGLIRPCTPTPLSKVDGVWVIRPVVYAQS